MKKIPQDKMNSVIINLPFTPATFSDSVEYLSATCIYLSDNAHNWAEYTLESCESLCETLEYISDFIHLSTNLCNDRYISKKSIVSMSPVRIAIIKVINRGNSYYGAYGEIHTYAYILHNDEFLSCDSSLNKNTSQLPELDMRSIERMKNYAK